MTAPPKIKYPDKTIMINEQSPSTIKLSPGDKIGIVNLGDGYCASLIHNNSFFRETTENDVLIPEERWVGGIAYRVYTLEKALPTEGSPVVYRKTSYYELENKALEGKPQTKIITAFPK